MIELFEQFGEAREIFAIMRREFGRRQFAAGTLLGRLAVFEITRHRLLAMIEVERCDARAACLKRDRDMDRGGRLAGAALFVGEDDGVGFAGVRHADLVA